MLSLLQVIYDSSVGSAHFKAAQARNDKVAERIEKMKKNLTAAKARSSVHSPLAQAAALRMQRKLADMEQSRTLDRNWIHIDMDAFYAGQFSLPWRSNHLRAHSGCVNLIRLIAGRTASCLLLCADCSCGDPRPTGAGRQAHRCWQHVDDLHVELRRA